MAESSRSVRKTKDGRKIITRTKKNGATVRKTLSAKGEDGKRTVKGSTTSRTNKSGVEIKRRTKANGATVSSRTNAEKGTSSSRKTNAKGNVTSITKSRTTKKGEVKTTEAKRGTGRVKAANKLKKATTESKGKAGRIKRLQERKAVRVADGKKTTGIGKKIRAAKKSLRSGVQKRIDKKKEA